MVVVSDTSFLLSSYLGDCHGGLAVDFLSDLDSPLVISWLCRLEFLNGVQQQVFQKNLGQGAADLVNETITRHYSAGKLLDGGILTRRVWSGAEDLVLRHTAALGTRSLDILHVAYALEANADCFLSFDRRQRALAEQVGLQVNPMD